MLQGAFGEVQQGIIREKQACPTWFIVLRNTHRLQESRANFREPRDFRWKYPSLFTVIGPFEPISAWSRYNFKMKHAAQWGLSLNDLSMVSVKIGSTFLGAFPVTEARPLCSLRNIMDPFKFFYFYIDHWPEFVQTLVVCISGWKLSSPCFPVSLDKLLREIDIKYSINIPTI